MAAVDQGLRSKPRFKMVRPLHVTAICLGFLGTFLIIVGTASTYWYAADVYIKEGLVPAVDVHAHFGLFRYCSKFSFQQTTYVCKNGYFSQSQKGHIDATRAMQIISILLAIASGLVHVLCQLVIKKDPYIPVIILDCLSGVFGIIGVNIFSHNFSVTYYYFGWSFYMCWIGAVMMLMSNVFYIADRRRQRAGMQKL